MMPWVHLPPWLHLVVDLVAVYRITRLVTADTLTQPWRDRIIRWAYLRWSKMVGPDEVAEDVMGSGTMQAMAEADEHEAPWLARLIICRWCSSMHIAAGAVAAEWAVPAAWHPLAWGLTLASGAALLAGLEI